MNTKCPHCETVQEPNVEVGDIDICDECGREYQQYTNMV